MTKPYKHHLTQFRHGDIHALENIEIPAVPFREFCEIYAPLKDQILTEDYIQLLDGRTVTAIIQPSKNKVMAEYLGFHLDDEGVYIRSSQLDSASFKPHYNFNLKSPNHCDWWELKPLKGVTDIKGALIYLHELATSKEAAKSLLEDYLINKTPSKSPNNEPKSRELNTKTTYFQLINQADLINVSDLTSQEVTHIFETKEGALAYLYPMVEVERKLGFHEINSECLSRIELNKITHYRHKLSGAITMLENQGKTTFDFSIKNDLIAVLEVFDDRFGLVDGQHPVITKKTLLECELEKIRTMPNFDQLYDQKIRETYKTT